MIERLSVIGGTGGNGKPEPVPQVDICRGQLVTVVGPKGSGKSTFVQDIEAVARGNTISGRKVIVNGDPVDGIERARNVRTKPALISHQTAIASRLSVGEFLRAHAQIRFQHVQKVKSVIDCALQLAADLTGRLISPSTRMTELSNHEIRAILVADAAKVCDVAVLLLDEVEGPATHSSRLLEQLRAPDRIVIMVTNDPRIALLSDCQIVMREGAISVVLKSTDQESELTSAIGRLDDFLYALREKVLKGQRVTVNDFKGLKVPH